MKEKIKSITEAYSMQPITFAVCKKEINIYELAKSTAHEHGKDCIIRIELELDPNTQLQNYVGYNEDGDVLFRYLSNSVNVHYFNLI